MYLKRIFIGVIIRLYAVKVLKGHIQHLAKIEQPAKCIGKEEKVA